MPHPPVNGFVQKLNETTALFACNEGYEAQGNLMAVCVHLNAEWIPDPATLRCTRDDTGDFMYI